MSSSGFRTVEVFSVLHSIKDYCKFRSFEINLLIAYKYFTNLPPNLAEVSLYGRAWLFEARLTSPGLTTKSISKMIDNHCFGASAVKHLFLILKLNSLLEISLELLGKIH